MTLFKSRCLRVTSGSGSPPQSSLALYRDAVLRKPCWSPGASAGHFRLKPGLQRIQTPAPALRGLEPRPDVAASWSDDDVVRR
jgi:hypothetical protein